MYPGKAKCAAVAREATKEPAAATYGHLWRGSGFDETTQRAHALPDVECTRDARIVEARLYDDTEQTH